MNLYQAVVLSIVEGVTEFLPVSSTGHMILAGKIMGLSQTGFTSSFEIFIQLGAILAIVALYSRKVIQNYDTLIRVGFAFVPTAIVGLVLYTFIKSYLLTNPWIVVWSLFLGGIALILLEIFLKRRIAVFTSIDQMPKKYALIIGLSQSLSVIPGISRAAATIIGGQLTGLSRQSAVEFSFLLALPTMISATGLDLIQSDFTSFTTHEFILMGTGFFVAFLVAFGTVKVFMAYTKHYTFIPFGIYRICIAILYASIVLAK